MAPTTGAKRSRPAFSPPRPGKAKASVATKSRRSNGGVGGVRKPSTTKMSGKGKIDARSQIQKQKQKRRNRAAAGTMRAILDDEADDDEDEDEEERMEEDDDGQDDEDSDEDNESGDSTEETNGTHLTNDDDSDEALASSPEPEFMLAEVTHHSHSNGATKISSNKNNSSDFPIPLPLIHRIMQSQFTTPEKTSLSTDARSLLGKYVEAFVREGIRRCVHERSERERETGAAGRDASESGWLEVEDLERVGVQLCLDF